MSPPFFLTLILFYICFMISLSHALKNGFSVELIHRDSPKSPLYQPTQNKYQHFVNAVRRSINRANYFYKKDSLTKNTPESTVIPGDGEFLMTYSVGTPPFKQFGFVDTGSGLIWLQCAPCKQCYNQTTPIFEPTKSSSYKNISCSSETCKSVEDTYCNEQNNCQYDITYEDGSLSQGDISIETLTLDSTNGNSISFPKTIIGCGNYNEMSYDGPSSGIVGLGGGQVSLPAQLKSSIGGKFSYCLTSLSSIMSKKTSKLNFGDAAVVSGDGVVSTPLGKKSLSSHDYYLTLESFSVGNESIKLGNSTNDNDDGNIIIDSGTTLTFLPSDVYANLESVVVKLVRLEQVKDPNHELNLCYRITSSGYDFPIITAHFKGGDIKLQSIHTFQLVADDIVCFAFASSPYDAIFGNVAQQNLLVGYDTQKQIVSFKPTDCAKV